MKKRTTKRSTVSTTTPEARESALLADLIWYAKSLGATLIPLPGRGKSLVGCRGQAFLVEIDPEPGYSDADRSIGELFCYGDGGTWAGGRIHVWVCREDVKRSLIPSFG